MLRHSISRGLSKANLEYMGLISEMKADTGRSGEAVAKVLDIHIQVA